MNKMTWLRVLLIACIAPVHAQVSGPPSAACHITDGSFSSCPSGAPEWSDVTPIPFPASGSFLYVNQSAAHTTLYLMYDFPARTQALAASDSVHISFNTVEQIAGVPKLITYDIDIFPNGTMQVLQQGKPAPAGNIVGAVGFGASPNSSVPHVTAELQVPLVAGPPSTYSDDPLFWGTTLPPSGLPPFTPRLPCVTDPGKQFSRCVKDELQAAQQAAANLALFLATAAQHCDLNVAANCSQLAPTLMSLSVTAMAVADRFCYILNSDPPALNCTIPPDPNYTTPFLPPSYVLSLPTTGTTPAEALDLATLSTDIATLASFQDAAIVSIAREEAANAAGDSASATTQTQFAQQYGTAAAALIAIVPAGFQALVTDLEAAGTQFTITAQEVAQLQTAINPASPSSLVQQQFVTAEQLISQQLQLASNEQALLVPAYLSVDPATVASLGTGVFPNGIEDPATVATLAQLAEDLALSEVSQTLLLPSFQITLSGDYVANGVGLSGQTSGNIAVTGVPAGATISNAFLYWGMLDNGEEAVLGQLNFNGSPILGTLVGSGPDTCTGRTNSFTYRADVTSLVSGNGTYPLTGVASGGNIAAQGASLIVVYQLAGAPSKTVIIADGNLSLPSGSPVGEATIFGLTATAPVTATTTFIVGNGQSATLGAATVQFLSEATAPPPTLSFPNLFNSGNGNFWDTQSFDVSLIIAAGPVSAVAAIQPSATNCLQWSAQAFSVTSAPNTTPDSETAAVVQATSTGNTVAKPNALTPGAAPTLQDQITQIVQFRTIQNRGLSASTLTSQLVSGLVSDGVITSTQGTTIQSGVLQSVVAPPVPAVCDVNGDGQIDKNDISLIQTGLNQPANGASDPRDADHNGVINMLDVRRCVLQCTHASCAVQ